MYIASLQGVQDAYDQLCSSQTLRNGVKYGNDLRVLVRVVAFF